MSNIDDILAGMEKIGGEIAVVQEEPKQSGKFSTFIVDAVDKAYADRLEALCRKLYEQADKHAKCWLFGTALEHDKKIRDAELAAIARGDKGEG